MESSASSNLFYTVLLEKYPVWMVDGSIRNPLPLHRVWEVMFKSQDWHRNVLNGIQLHYGFIYPSYIPNHLNHCFTTGNFIFGTFEYQLILLLLSTKIQL